MDDRPDTGNPGRTPTPLTLPLSSLQPSQFCFSIRKLRGVLESYDKAKTTPLPVRPVGRGYALTDSHHTAFVAYLTGVQEVQVRYETDDMDWEAHERSVEESRRRGVRRLPDLVGRLLSHDDYVRLWCGWCDQMHSELDQERRFLARRASPVDEQPQDRAVDPGTAT